MNEVKCDKCHKKYPAMLVFRWDFSIMKESKFYDDYRLCRYCYNLLQSNDKGKLF